MEPGLWATPIHDPVPPIAYSTWVWVVGFALLAAIVLWYLWVRRHTRLRPAPDLPQSHWSSLREGALTKIELAEQQYRDGHADLRGLHLELNTTLREFATGRLGRDAMWMTVEELSTLEGTDRLTDLLSDYQEPAFAYDSDAQAMLATSRAREVISQW